MSEKAEEMPCCAHLRISVRHVESKPGTVIAEWWECDNGCGTRFVPDRLAQHVASILSAAEARESFLRADLEREKAAAALVLETSAREVARLQADMADLKAKLETSWQASDVYAAEGEEARRERDALRQTTGELCEKCGWRFVLMDGCVGCERDALKAAAQRHLTTHGCDFVDANGRTCRDCDELRAALATPAEPPVKAPVVSLPGEGGTPPRVEGQSRFGPMPIKTPKGDR